MSTIDKFMVRTLNPSKERLSTKKCTSSEVTQYSEAEDKAAKHGKCSQKKDLAGEDADINGEADKAAAGLHAESTVEISYEDYLTENCDEPVDPNFTEAKAVDELQNVGRDIRSFFSKGSATFKLQNGSFSTIKVKAEVHEPRSKLSGEAFAMKSPVLLPGIFGKQRDGRRKCNKGCVEITDDDLVIEYLEDEIIKSDDVGGLLKVPSGIKSDKAVGLLKASVGSDSTLKNSVTGNLEHETVIGDVQVKKNPLLVNIIGACRGENPAKPEILLESMLNGLATERQNMNDVLMGRQRQVQEEPDSQKQKRNSDGGTSSSSKDKKTDPKKRVRGKGSQVNGCAKKECNDANVGEKSVSQDDEETRMYMPPVSTSVSSVLVKSPVSAKGEVPKEQVSELPKELKSNTKVDKLTTAIMNQMTSDTESPKRRASPVTQGEGRTLRRSRRQIAAAAIAAISIAMQDSGSKRQKKMVAEDDEEHETIDLDSDAEQMPDEAKVHHHHSRRTNVPTKTNTEKIQSPGLAPIFVKRNANDSSKRSTPKLSAAEREAILIKRSFLLSGVPVELKKIQNIQQLAALPLVDAPFPTHSHTYQGNSADERINGTFQPWCLPEVTLNLKDPSGTLLPSVDVKMLHLGQFTSLSNDKKSMDGDKIELGSLLEISRDMLPMLLSEVKLRNPSFPTHRVYHQLSLRKNRDLKTKTNDISKTSASSHLKAKSKKVSKRKKAGHSDVRCENAEDDPCSETQSLLWTEKYAPTQANEIIGNWDACKKLRDWLTEWKQVVSRHASNGYFQPDRKPSDDVSGDFDSSDDNSNYCESEDGSLCNTMLLLGAHGIGKTAMVYALAQELDFKVFEVNASGSRDGRYVLTQLQEATQSHQVSRGHRTDAASEQHEEPITDQAMDKMSGRQKTPKILNPVGGFLARWSAMQSLFEPEKPPPKKRCRRIKSTESRSPSKKQQQQDMKTLNQDTRKPSLILFDEVDTVFEDDRGFWSAVQTFMKTTKRPIILTATDRRFVEKFGGRCETLQLRTPRLVNTTSYVQLVCLLENIRTSYSDLLSLVESFNGDIRRTLLSLQYWVDSGAARHLVSNQPVHRYVGTCPREPQILAPETKAEDRIVAGRCVIDASNAQESDDDFQRIVPRKRRRVQICLDDESSSQGGSRGPCSASSPVKNVPREIEDVSQSCSLAPSESEFRFDGETAVQELKAAEEQLLLPLHWLSGQVLGICNTSGLSPMMQDLQKNCAKKVFASCRHQKSSILNKFIQHLQSSITKQELCAEGSVPIESKTIDGDCRMQQASMRSLYDAYKNISYADVYCCAMSKRCADEDMRGNTYWHFQEKADETIDAIEALVLSMCEVRRKDSNGKQNASAEKEVVALQEDDNLMQDNYYSRLFQENTSIVEGVKQSVIHPAITLCADYMPALRAICRSEELRKATPHRRRFNHYLSNALPTMRCSLFTNMALQFP